MVRNEEPCHFPFRFHREMYYSCLPGSFADPEPWCATTENYDRDQQRRYCEKEERPRGHCDPNPCRNGAVCEARRTGFHCICNPGFYGKRCEKESCFESLGRLHIGEKETWLRYQPAGLEECHCAGKKKIVCKPVYGKACTSNPCLNGGHCIMLKQGWVCGCPGRFSGPLCDIDHSHTCYSGNGHLYRGIAQSTSLGEPCLPWDSPILFHEFSSNTLENAVSLGLGSHAFCRNPDNDSQPWCYVLRDKQVSWGFCNVPHCYPHTNAHAAFSADSESTVNVGKHVESVTESPDRTNGTQSSAGSAPVCGQRYTKTASQRSRVVGGMVAHSDAHPYMAAMYLGEQFCGGSLIDSFWILTAAHCLERRPAVSQISVVLGQTLYNVTTKSSIKFQVQGYQLHENYSEINKHHDIALVRLKENGPGHCAEFSHSISPVCLPSSVEIYDEGNRCQVAGWGHLYEGEKELSLYLQEADVPVIPHEQCQAHNVHGTRVTPKMLCAGYMDGRSDACQGDSGGPLVCEEQNKAILRGIVSWGTGCAQENKPGVYTNVAHYLDWIRSKMH
ncbi:PREDICTED: coagulation factor XII [Gekko japonicus]|uniref:Coagulation factor XII n=1 Tax=Gekko japonicus TaxID=146911 RepID=A0ABM1K2P9_GEKJA|nr:PREDICTED: coagulation factor XII [Gekko japonicus]